MKKEADYIINATKAIKLLTSNLKLLIPDLTFFIIWLLLLIAFFFFNFSSLISLVSTVYHPKLLEVAIRNILTSNNTLIKIIVSLTAFIIIHVLIGLRVSSMRYEMIRAVIKGEKLTLMKAYKESGRYVITIFLIKLFLVLLIYIPLIIISIFGILVLFLKNSQYVGIPIIILLILALITYLVLIKLAFLFTYPTLMLKTKKGAFKTLKETYNYYKQNKKKSLIVFLILLAVSIIIGLALSAMSAFKPSLGLVSIILFLIFFIIKEIIGIIVNLWGEIFIFENF